jgi:outer membrane protein
MKQVLGKWVLLGAMLATSALASAQSAGSWLVKVGVNRIDPDVSSGDLSPPSLPNTQVNVKSATAAIFTLGYMLSDAVALEFYTGLPYQHDVVGAGAISGVGKIGSVKQVSPTLFAQYRFLAANAPFRPYLGLGLTYAHFYDEQGSGTLTALTNPGGSATLLSSSSAFGVSPQLGATLRLTDRWFVDASVVKTLLKNKNTLSTGQTVYTELNPVSTNVSLGYRF